MVINVQHSTSASPTIQHSTLPQASIHNWVIHNRRRKPRTIQHSTLKTQHSNWSLMFTRLNKMECKVRTKLDVNIQNSTLRTAHNSTSAEPTIQHSTFNTQHSTLNIAVGFNSQLTNSQSQAFAENNSKLNIQHSTLRSLPLIVSMTSKAMRRKWQ